MSAELGVVIIIVVLRVFCLVAYTLLALHSLATLIYKEQPRELREVTVFLLLLMSAISYGSFLSMYTWVTHIEEWSVVADPFNAMVLAIMFTVPGLIGLKRFKPWKINR